MCIRDRSKIHTIEKMIKSTCHERKIELLEVKDVYKRQILNLLQMKEFNHQAELTTGVLEEECSQMMKDFFKELRSRRTKKE